MSLVASTGAHREVKNLYHALKDTTALLKALFHRNACPECFAQVTLPILKLVRLGITVRGLQLVV